MKQNKDAEHTIHAVEELQSRFRDRQFNRREMLRRLMALGLSTTAISYVMADRGMAQSEGPGEQIWDGQPFDAGGETVTVAHWGGELEDLARRAVIQQFEEDFNCRVAYDNGWPWFTKMSLAGPDNPPIDLYSGNLPEAMNLDVRGFFVSHDDIRANCPSVADLYQEVAFYGPGVIWALHVMGLAYRTDVIPEAPDSLEALWDPAYDGRKSIFGPANDLQSILFMSVSKVWGEDQYDMETAFSRFADGRPWIISPFTGETMNLMERGEVDIAWQTDGEALLQTERGLPIRWARCKEVAPFNQMHSAVSRGSSPMKKKLAYALLDRYCSAEAGTMWSEGIFFHPLNLKSQLAQPLIDLGYSDPATDLASLFMPDWRWFINNQTQIVDTMNAILAS
jgi:putative spermidine/putrescine transport system substrate-binding protein